MGTALFDNFIYFLHFLILFIVVKQNRPLTTRPDLLITIIVLVILAAVTLNSIFGSNIIGIAINGAMGYAEEQQKELGMLNNVSGILSDIRFPRGF